MKIKFADNSEMTILTCNESYDIIKRSDNNSSMLTISFATSKSLEQLKELFTSEIADSITIVNDAGQQNYRNLNLARITRNFTEKEMICFVDLQVFS